MKAIVLLLGVIGSTACGTTIQPGQRGIKYLAFSDPGLQREVRREGFYFQFPWNDIVKYDVTWKSKTERIEVLTLDTLHVSSDVTITYRPKPDRLYELATQIGESYYEDIVKPPFLTLARSEFAKTTHNDLAKRSPDIEAQTLAKVRQAIAGKPVEVYRISISHIEYDPSVTAAISRKVAMAQAVEQKEFELRVAERDAEIARTAARGRADATRIQAEGEAAAIFARGEAQARAQGAISKTLTSEYLRYKAFDNDATRYYFVPIGKDGLPLIINTEAGGRPGGMR